MGCWVPLFLATTSDQSGLLAPEAFRPDRGVLTASRRICPRGVILGVAVAPRWLASKTSLSSELEEAAALTTFTGDGTAAATLTDLRTLAP